MEILLQLFFSFAAVGLVCVGGGYASMPLIQAEVIDQHGWLTMTEFVDIFTLSQMTPGPIGINAATFVGSKVAGIPGSIAATLGFVFPSVFIVLFLGYLYYKYGNVAAIRGILNGLRPAVVALIGSAGLNFILLAFWNREKLPVDLASPRRKRQAPSHCCFLPAWQGCYSIWSPGRIPNYKIGLTLFRLCAIISQ